ncbi:hypothetical protein HRG_009061 [Hirsutella rhossiliensis]|uniref:Uncharacterized protein n=1 Tax=Hirsutella rhossiliensis TaxID=111463 RepID=A0A9P8MRQ0_9HYPO|nr:uncharacterized protein HRG_09061 [Hirsutella rhossiliensis]KAH0960040.1 hypothetical protein HRG_09061 [Hirsutella rhossiliensis]
MGREGQPTDSNIFVRFKQHVDSHVASGFRSLLGLTSTPPRQAATMPLGSDSPPSPPSSSSRTMDAQDMRRAHWDLDVFSLLSSASYSPPALRHLPQPVPNDLAPGMDSTVFTFEDAFEDLLAASQGQRLPDINARYQQRRLLRHMFPTGEPTWFWMRRLESQRLVRTPSWESFPPALLPDWENFHPTTDWSELWRAAISEDRPEPSHNDFFHELGKPSGPERDDDSPHQWTGSRERQVRRPAPDTFDHLFSSLSSAFAESQTSWDAFLNVIMTHAAPGEKYQDPEPAGGTKQVETRDEYVDRAGYLHSTVTRRTLDERGNEIGRETYVTMRPADDDQGDDEDSVEFDGQGSSSKKAGWFWK